MIAFIRRKLAAYRFQRELERNLRARRALRSQRRQAALKGWQTRKAA